MKAAQADLDRFSNLSILVVGDFFVDEYVHTEMFEISKEGPIPVLRYESRRRAAGAAGNLASSIRGLGADVIAVGVRGDDENGQALDKELRGKGIDTSGLVIEDQPTWTYNKFRARVENAPEREIFRLDVLPRGYAAEDVQQRVARICEEKAADVDGIIVLDQVAHLIGPVLLETLPGIAKRHSALLHGSSREHIGEFRQFDLIIPNEIEACAALDEDPTEVTDFAAIGERLRAHGSHAKVLLTLGPDGMVAIADQGSPSSVPTYARDIVDVTGAGDAVASTAMLGNALGWPLEQTAQIASRSAAIAIAQVGTHHVSRVELEAALRTE